MKVIIDPYKIYKSARKNLLVVSESTYVISRTSLLDYFVSGKEDFENIHVTEHPFTKWYDDLGEHLQVIKPVKVLAEKFPQARISEDLSDNDVISLNLLDIPIEPSEREIIKHFLGIILPTNLNAISIYSAIYTLAQAVNANRQAFEQGYILRVWKTRLSSIAIDCDAFTKAILQPVIDVDHAYCYMLTLGIYGSKSKAFYEHWVEDVALEFLKRCIKVESIQGIIPNIHPALPINDKAEAVMKRFFEENLRSKRLGLNDFSGYYPAELEALLSVPRKIDLITYDLLLEKFSLIIDQRQQNALKKLIIPELAPVPSLTGLSIQQQAVLWKEWAVSSFIPYKFYYDEAEIVDSKALSLIELNAVLFGDWLFENLGSVLNEDDIYTNIDIVKTVREHMKNNSSVIWLIIDGLAGQYTSTLETVLKSNGINRIQTNWSFATLPTITELAIPITISGRYGRSIEDSDFSNRANLLKKAFPDKVAIYSSQASEFHTSLNKTFDLCCLHVRDIDTEMHKSERDFYSGRTAEIERHLEKYVGIVSALMRKAPERKMSLVISTDHGATKCLMNEQMIKNQKLNELAQSRPRERCVPLTAQLEIETWEKQDIYMLGKAVSRNKFDWAIARGYKYFGRNDSGYRHGGLTPEEVIVPVLTGCILELDVIKLSIRPIGFNEFRFGKSERNFKFRIRNSNINSIQISKVTVLQEKDTIFHLPLDIPANAEADLTGTIKLHPRLKAHSKDGKLNLELAVKYTLLGHHYEDVINLDILTERDEFENDFL
ncbi:hypothetical protein L0663_10295 [Dyadobacter sp. CY107]|uniref:hypothetical protein n=1 Tax=Dyadobacter fanqingshengii TaxID=2906443 RepID=UPI001F1E125D|nr:hypothetical protein [Dyadobacter fanqingshengii]MCF2503767.1 hypothetical protein [Dyadobacter fanqingshengii]